MTFKDVIMTGDNVEIMRGMPEGSIDLTVTSPPYDGLRTYNGYSFDFESVAKELFRVTKDGGVVVWVINDSTIKGSESGTSFRQALYFKEVGFNLHDTMIWHKKNPMPTQRNRYEASFEYMFVLSKGKPSTANLLREPTKGAGTVRVRHRASNGKGHEKTAEEGTYEYNKTKIKHNVWVIPTVSFKTGHPAPFPEEIARKHIVSWSNPGDLVFDPFGGSGTTAKMALLNGRNYLHIDISDEYNDIARQRIVEAIT